MSVIGERVRRLDDPPLLRGEAHFVDDLPLDAWHVGFVRSLYAHARVSHLDLSTARSLPDVIGVYAADDLPETREPTPVTPTSPHARAHGFYPLAPRIVRYVGEPVAVVVARNREAMADAVAAAEIEYEPLPPVVDPEHALDGEALVWDDAPQNILDEMSAGYGDAAAAFSAADLVVEGRYAFPRAAGASLEPRGVAAAMEGGTLTLWDSTQSPHNVRSAVAEYFDLGEAHVRVIAPHVGGGFGPKGRSYPEEIVLAALARRLNHPVRWVATRTEDLQATGQGRGQIHRARLALRRDGTLLGLDDRIVYDAGAFGSGAGIAANTVRHLIGPYHLPALHAHVTAVYTNKCPGAALRGGGRPEGVYVMERLLDKAAGRLGLDPAEIRRRNFLPADVFPHDTGLRLNDAPVIYDSGDFPRYLREALELAGYDEMRRQQAELRRAGRCVGIGLVAFIESTGAGFEEARVSVQEDGVTVTVGSPSTGQGHATTFAQIAAQHLGVPVPSVRVISGDTTQADGIGTFASRMTYDGGNAVGIAAREVAERLRETAAELLEAAPEDIVLADGRAAVRGVEERSIHLNQVIRAASSHELTAFHRFAPEHHSVWAGGVTIVMAEVDAETGRVQILRYVVVHDSGTLINPTNVEGQIHGGVVHGIGNVLFDACVFGEDGQNLTSTFADYSIPTFDTAPAIEIKHLQTPSPFGPEGAKGTGESGTIAAIPAMVSALEDALRPYGAELHDLPLPPETLLRAMREL